MNEMAMVEYLLRKYAFFSLKLKSAIKNKSDFAMPYYCARLDQLEEIITDRFGMQIEETDTEYIAENSVCSVKVRKE